MFLNLKYEEIYITDFKSYLHYNVTETLTVLNILIWFG